MEGVRSEGRRVEGRGGERHRGGGERGRAVEGEQRGVESEEWRLRGEEWRRGVGRGIEEVGSEGRGSSVSVRVRGKGREDRV